MVEFMDTYQRLAVTKESSCVSNNHLPWVKESQGRLELVHFSKPCIQHKAKSLSSLMSHIIFSIVST